MWRRVRTIFAAWGWALLAVLGVVLAGMGLGLRLSNGSQDPWAATALSFAQAILAAGMVTGVMRAAQTAGFFRDQLREVIYDDNLAGSIIDARKAWSSLTRGLFRQRFAGLPDDSLNSLSVDTLIGSAEYYYEAHWRRLEIDWEDKEKTKIRIRETVNSTLRTADIGRDIVFENRYDPETNDSERNAFSYTFTSEKGDVRSFGTNDLKVLDDNKQVLETRLAPNSKYQLMRQTTKIQKVQSDPIMNYRSTCLWADPEIVVSTPRESNLLFYFRAIGTPPFVSKDSSSIDGALESLNAQCKALCLPNQGYMIVVVTK